jgi:hypothetical protein
MNRETRRRLKQNVIKNQSVIPPDQSKLAEHYRIKRALDEGIMLGFSAASHLFEKVAKTIGGIGEKRSAAIRKAFEMELKRMQKEIE